MRNYKIDILRGISILLVLLHHFNIPYKLKDTWLGFDFLGEAFSCISHLKSAMHFTTKPATLKEW